MEIVLIVVGIVIVALQVLQFVDRRKQEPSATLLADPTAPVYVADDVQKIVRESLDFAMKSLGEQARADREEAIKLGSQQVAKDSSEQLGQKADSISQTLTTIKDAMEKKIGELDKELRELRENNRSQFDNVGKAVDTLSRRTENLNEVLSNSQKRGQWGERLAEDMLRAAGFIDGVNYTKQDINAAGGVLGQPVEWTLKDSSDGDNPAIAPASATELLDSGVDAIVGAAASGVTRLIIDQVTKAKVVQISMSNTAPDLSTWDDGGYYFRTAPSDLLQGAIVGNQIVAAGKEDLLFDTALKLGTDLEAQGISVMLDDRRDASPGVKFKDAELIGNPIIVVVGKALAEGNVEVRVRKSGDKKEVALASAVTSIAELLK